MRKRIVALVLLPMLLLTLFSGCASRGSDALKSKLIGTWTLKYYVIEGEKEYSPVAVTFSFYENGKLQAFASMESESGSDEARWMLDDEENTLIISDGDRTAYLGILKLTSSELLLNIPLEYAENESYQMMFGR